MAPISVKVSYAKTLHRFTLESSSRRPISFLALCEALVDNLKLPLSASRLAHPRRSPFQLWFLDDEYDYVRLVDDPSLREALRISPRLLRVKMRLVPGASVSGPVSVRADLATGGGAKSGGKSSGKGSGKNSRSGSKKSSDDIPELTTKELLSFVHHLRNNANPTLATEVVNAYNKALRSSSDLRALAKVQPTLAKLFSTFLYHVSLAGGPISEALSAQLTGTLEKILASARVSAPTAVALLRAIEFVCACSWAAELLRNKYALVVDSDGGSVASVVKAAVDAEKAIVRPVKHYKRHFEKMMKAGGKGVSTAYLNLKQEAKKGFAAEGRTFKLTRTVCKGLERAAFHFARCHVSEEDLTVEKRALKALARSVCRKLIKAGMDERLVEYVSKLVVELAKDVKVRTLLVHWADRPVRVAAALTAEDESKDLPEFARESDYSSSEELEGWNEDKDLGRSRYRESRSRSPTRKKSSARSPSPRRVRTRSPQSDRNKRPNRRRSSFWDNNDDSEESSQSEESERGMRAWGVRRSRNDIDIITAVQPGEDPEGEPRSREWGKRDEDLPSLSDTLDTRESKWGRVERSMEHEAEVGKAGEMEFGRWKQMERERQMDIQLALESERDKELEIRNSIPGISSRRYSTRDSRRRRSGSTKNRSGRSKGSRSRRSASGRQRGSWPGPLKGMSERTRSARYGQGDLPSGRSFHRDPSDDGGRSGGRKFGWLPGRREQRESYGGREPLFI